MQRASEVRVNMVNELLGSMGGNQYSGQEATMLAHRCALSPQIPTLERSQPQVQGAGTSKLERCRAEPAARFLCLAATDPIGLHPALDLHPTTNQRSQTAPQPSRSSLTASSPGILRGSTVSDFFLILRMYCTSSPPCSFMQIPPILLQIPFALVCAVETLVVLPQSSSFGR